MLTSLPDASSLARQTDRQFLLDHACRVPSWHSFARTLEHVDHRGHPGILTAAPQKAAGYEHSPRLQHVRAAYLALLPHFRGLALGVQGGRILQHALCGIVTSVQEYILHELQQLLVHLLIHICSHLQGAAKPEMLCVWKASSRHHPNTREVKQCISFNAGANLHEGY